MREKRSKMMPKLPYMNNANEVKPKYLGRRMRGEEGMVGREG